MSAPPGGDSGFEAFRLEVRGRGLGQPGANGAEDIGQIEDPIHKELSEAMGEFTEDGLRRVAEQAIASMGDSSKAPAKANGERVGGREPGIEPRGKRGAREMEDGPG